MPNPSTGERVLKLLTELNPATLSIVSGPKDQDKDLFDAGILDSVGVLELVRLAEEEFNIVVDLDDVSTQNFKSLKEIVLLFESKYIKV